MKMPLSIIISSTLFFSACTHIRKPLVFDDINKMTTGKHANVSLLNGRVLSGSDIQIARDSTFWRDLTTNKKQSIATSEVSNIIIKKSDRGALEGAGLGLLFGGVAGAVIGFASGDDPGVGKGGFEEIVAYTAGQKAFGYGIVLGGAGGLLGLYIGAAVGSKDKFVVNASKQ
jgi:hypothetical protein